MMKFKVGELIVHKNVKPSEKLGVIFSNKEEGYDIFWVVYHDEKPSKIEIYSKDYLETFYEIFDEVKHGKV